MRAVILCVLSLSFSLLAEEGKASFDLGDPPKTIHCKWIAEHEGGLRYEETDGRLVTLDADQMKYVSNIKGTVLKKTPVIHVVEHTMHCSGGVCKNSSTTKVHEHWPGGNKK